MQCNVNNSLRAERSERDPSRFSCCCCRSRNLTCASIDPPSSPYVCRQREDEYNFVAAAALHTERNFCVRVCVCARFGREGGGDQVFASHRKDNFCFDRPFADVVDIGSATAVATWLHNCNFCLSG
jgi:hypothetical protein